MWLGSDRGWNSEKIPPEYFSKPLVAIRAQLRDSKRAIMNKWLSFLKTHWLSHSEGFCLSSAFDPSHEGVVGAHWNHWIIYLCSLPVMFFFLIKCKTGIFPWAQLLLTVSYILCKTSLSPPLPSPTVTALKLALWTQQRAFLLDRENEKGRNKTTCLCVSFPPTHMWIQSRERKDKTVHWGWIFKRETVALYCTTGYC